MTPKVSYEYLSPLSLLERSAFVYPDKIAIVYNEERYTYAQFSSRVQQLSNALANIGIHKGDKVAFLVPNTPPMLEGHFGPLRLGAVLVSLNIRLSSRELSYILNHSEAKVLIFDSELAPVVREFKDKVPGVQTYVQVVDTVPKADDIEGPDYESFIRSATNDNYKVELDSELDTVAINYTSGTTGMPKGVEYHARGAYLAAIGEILEMGMNWRSVYLWTLPMFHCNGWCFTWGVTAVAGTHVCLRRVDPEHIYSLIDQEDVTNLCAAPTVLTALYSSSIAKYQDLSGLTIGTAGAPPAPQVIRTIEGMGARVLHLYGLTETYGPHTICAEQPSWDFLSAAERAVVKARQGVSYIMTEPGLRVVDDQMRDVLRNGADVGEVVMRGNNVMTGYFKDPEATAKAFLGGWFHSGDLAVWHTDGYIELRDRAKDVIISGGENISSQEVEKVVMEHPGVLEVCVIGVPDEKWGEVAKAFVVSRPGIDVTEDEIIKFCRDRIAHFKSPKYIEFGDLPKTATGKIQKFLLREKEWEGYEKRIH
ncbi:acyl--CoA ligase family protein [Dehalococcoidia bacterium]|nr:acyl--CoA ligase family protein [Dehalococcoidia bacterium]